MNSRNEESPGVRALPNPPPLPVSFTNSRQEIKFVTRKSAVRKYCCTPSATKNTWDCLFDEGYRADVSINIDNGGILYAHASILGMNSPVFKSMLSLKQSRARGRCGHQRSISISGVPPEAVQVFIRFLYSSRYEEEKMKEHGLSLLVLSHAYAVPHLKRECELQLEQRLTTENVVDIFQLALLCDASRLSLLCHRFMLKHLKPVSATEGWNAMKQSHPVLEKQILRSVIDEDMREKERVRKNNERKIYMQLYEAMEALVHICKDGCRTIGPRDKVLKEDQEPCQYAACKGLELLIRHFAGCKLRVPGGCIHCKRMWQVLELHSRLCANSDVCRVPLCRNFKQKRRKQNKKDEMKWRILVRKIARSKSISGAPFFSFEST
ncbi:BTB/POZ and TAZ domain-containing protein 4 [Nicotiana tabacum]|uniref:BTB/POZ and TAZ domain-containing protein 4 n=3 Tax=Nicotiana TaxID=4085 RepID=A0A1S3X4S2_TOBAC|nr:PREDICTED: BTB/POZ and TAZ domain-containing protein 4-like [Nicotiana sylvestris]XP_009759978.1 PREDICTED: BTB/POZ and TAZ domain-containing protein 4-like [Nicotiana sylvestris]XP_009759979.1 PREDICTED: BTB/POZ and TAZ domain-containing protein 4-like [Nicotiana sylvestris]XP_016434919.1 PREDICTED: BTB/POZ and TAZ domain-containing protein 4-like [Nicotiana tabacum]XP_016434920.1 PREDICTED: BTB/POZ and TAZ domain-containing protein 4-like [Nicotiana tabacum]XP_016434921.1 PREDICTED: BTB/P